MTSMSNKNWHRADIIAALHKRGLSLAQLSRRAGLASTTLANTLNRPWPKGEWIIATALDRHPADIWPDRYDPARSPRRPRHPPAASATLFPPATDR